MRMNEDNSEGDLVFIYCLRNQVEVKFLSRRGVVRKVRWEDEGDPRGEGETWESDLDFQIRKYRSSHSAIKAKCG